MCSTIIIHTSIKIQSTQIYDSNKDFSSILLKKNKYKILFMQTQDERRMEEHNVTVVVEFAIALMSVLDQINRESFQRFRLRIGLNHGPVIHLTI